MHEGQPRRVWWVVAGAAVALHIALSWWGRSPGILTGQDDAEYTILSQALRQGSYREIWRIDQPVHSQYPPGYPALLALWGSAVGGSYDALVSLNVILSAVTLILVFVSINRLFRAEIAAASVLVLAVNLDLVSYAGTIASETAYTFFSVVCFYFLLPSRSAGPTHPSGEARAERPGSLHVAAAGLAALAAAMTRSIGVTLIAALGLYLIVRKRWTSAILFGVASLIVLGSWFAWTSRAPEQFSGRSYMAEIQVARERGILPSLALIGKRALWYPTRSVPFNLSIPTIKETIIDNVVASLALGVLTLSGLVVFFRRWTVAALYLSVYGALLLIWVWEQARFITPLNVFLVPMIFVGGSALARRWRPQWTLSVVLACVILLFYGGAAASMAVLRENRACRTGDTPAESCLNSNQAQLFAALRFIRTGLPQDAVILTVKSGALYTYTGRRSVSAEGARTRHPDDFIDFLTGQGSQYILLASVDNIERVRLSNLVLANCQRLEVVRSFSVRTLLLRIKSQTTGDAGTGSDSCEAIALYRQAQRPLDE